MKKNGKASFLAALWWLLGCLCVGVLLVLLAPRESRPSQSENRMLEGFPVFNRQTLQSGAFFAGIEDYLSDGFFARAKVVEASDTLLEVFNRQTEEQSQMQELAEIDRLLAHGVSPEPEETASGESPIAGKTLVVTGTMERMGRKEIEGLIEKLGGKAAGSVSKKTDYVIAGESAGSKLEKARTLGVPVLSETEFFDMIEGI